MEALTQNVLRSGVGARATETNVGPGGQTRSSRRLTCRIKVNSFKEPPSTLKLRLTPTSAPRAHAATTAGATSSASSPVITAPTSSDAAVATNGHKVAADADSAASTATGQLPMSWTKQWWPVAVEDSLDPSLPHKVTLMGKDLVLWKAADGGWGCLDIACPHRGGPLDQGRVQGNCLQCSYHGWQFAADGACKDVSQSENPAKYCSIKAAQAGAYPVRAAQGLLWVWGESGAAAADEAAATPLKAEPDVEDPERYIWRFPWLARDVMISYEYGLDNFFDIAHAPFAHDGVLGISAESNERELPVEWDFGPHHMSLLTIPSTKPGEVQDVKNSPPVKLQGQQLNFYPPVMATADNFMVDTKGNRTRDILKLVVYRAPIRPGVSKVFYNMLLSTQIDPKQMKGLMSSPPWAQHAEYLRFFDGDLVLIHDQERLIANKGGWRKGMFMPHPSDMGIAKFRSWFDKVGPIPYAGDISLGPIQPRHVVLDHYEQHSKTCKACQQGIRLLRTIEYGCYAAAGLISIISLKFAELSPSGSAAADVAAFLAPYLGLAAAAALVMAGLKAKQYVQDNFFFKDYVQSRSGR